MVVRNAEHACRQAAVVVVKEIRLVGQLGLLAASLGRQTRGDASTGTSSADVADIIHLVRDPRPMLASQFRLGWWVANSSRSRMRVAEMQRVARKTCDGMLADAEAGERLRRETRVRYSRIRFEELTNDLGATITQVYGTLGLEMPLSTSLWVNRTLRGHCAHGETARSGSTTDKERFEYGTCRKRVSRRPRWKHELSRREKRAIQRHCSDVMLRFGYQ